jgi:hypothetical protein
MTLDYSEPGFLKLNMIDCVSKVLSKMPEDMDGTATSPAADHLFKIIDRIELLHRNPSPGRLNPF